MKTVIKFNIIQWIIFLFLFSFGLSYVGIYLGITFVKPKIVHDTCYITPTPIDTYKVLFFYSDKVWDKGGWKCNIAIQFGNNNQFVWFDMPCDEFVKSDIKVKDIYGLVKINKK